MVPFGGPSYLVYFETASTFCSGLVDWSYVYWADRVPRQLRSAHCRRITSRSRGRLPQLRVADLGHFAIALSAPGRIHRMICTSVPSSIETHPAVGPCRAQRPEMLSEQELSGLGRRQTTSHVPCLLGPPRRPGLILAKKPPLLTRQLFWFGCLERQFFRPRTAQNAPIGWQRCVNSTAS